MKHLHLLFPFLLLLAVLTTASCTDEFSEHPANQGYVPPSTSLIQTLDSINSNLDSSSTVRRPSETGEKNSSDDSDDLTARVVRLFSEACEQCNDSALIIHKYVDAIDASDELSPEEKTSLKYGFATALYSTNYWEKEFK